MEGPVARLAEQGVDLIVAADCCYIDQDGKSPSTPAFVRTCWGLRAPRCLVAFERRAPEVRLPFSQEREGRAWRTPAGHACWSCCCSCGNTRPPRCRAPPPPPQVRACLLEEARKLFRRVKQVPLSALPRPLRLEYCDIWELTRPVDELPAGMGPS